MIGPDHSESAETWLGLAETAIAIGPNDPEQWRHAQACAGLAIAERLAELIAMIDGLREDLADYTDRRQPGGTT